MKQTRFNQLWKNDPRFKSWLAEYELSPFYFFCQVCQKKIDLSNMGETALTKHMATQKHSNLVRQRLAQTSGLLSSWVRPTPHGSGETLPDESTQSMPEGPSDSPHQENQENIDNPGPSISSNTKEQSTLNQWVSEESVLKAEILWNLHCSVNHLSYRSNTHTSAIFAKIFPDSNIAQKYSCAKDKCSYLTTFGIAPFFYENLTKKVGEADFYSISFDEAFNGVTKNEQMDLAVRYWDVNLSQPVTRYLGSEFLGHATAENCLISFNKATSVLDHNKMIHVGMDGPAVNHKFFRLLQEQRNNECKYFSLIIE